MKKETKASLIKLILSLLGIVCVCLGAFFLLRHFGLTDISREQLQDFISAKGALGPFVFILATFLQVTIIPIPSTVTVLGGNYLFGPFLSFLYSYIGLILGSLFAFFLGKKLGKPYLNWIAGDSRKVDKWLLRMNGKEKVFLFFAFLFPAFPDDFLCSVAGVTTLGYGGFILMQLFTRATSVGATLLFVSGEFIPYEGWGLWVIGILIALGILCFILCLIFSDRLYRLFDKMTEKIKGALKVTNTKRYDFIIFGNGAYNCCLAIALIEKGKTVLLIQNPSNSAKTSSVDYIDKKFKESAKSIFTEFSNKTENEILCIAMQNGIDVLNDADLRDIKVHFGKITSICVLKEEKKIKYKAKHFIE